VANDLWVLGRGNIAEPADRYLMDSRSWINGNETNGIFREPLH
jgi:hypothetical protein